MQIIFMCLVLFLTQIWLSEGEFSPYKLRLLIDNNSSHWRVIFTVLCLFLQLQAIHHCQCQWGWGIFVLFLNSLQGLANKTLQNHRCVISDAIPNRDSQALLLYACSVLKYLAKKNELEELERKEGERGKWYTYCTHVWNSKRINKLMNKKPTFMVNPSGQREVWIFHSFPV